jgi:hypothetical protein
MSTPALVPSFGSIGTILPLSNRGHKSKRFLRRFFLPCFAAFFCSTAPQAFFCPDRGFPRPTRAAAVKDGPSSGHRFSGAQRP